MPDHALRVSTKNKGMEAKGRNGWFAVHHLTVKAVTPPVNSPPLDTHPAHVIVEGWATRSGWRAPVALQFTNPDDLRWLAQQLSRAAEALEQTNSSARLPQAP
jgi:hypothetical protein